MKTTAALTVAGVVLILGSFNLATVGPRLSPALFWIGFTLLVIASARGLWKGPSPARWAVLLFWASIAAMFVALLVPLSRRAPGIEPSGPSTNEILFALSIGLLILSFAQGLRAYLTDRSQRQSQVSPERRPYR